MFPFKKFSDGSFDYSNEDDDDNNNGLSRHETLESRATFRILAPKRKGRNSDRKGSKGVVKESFSLSGSGSGSASEAENIETDIFRQLGQFTTKGEATITKTPDEKQENIRPGALNYLDPDPTPTQARLEFDYDTFPALGTGICVGLRDRDTLVAEDSDSSVQNTIEIAMSHDTKAFATKDNNHGDDAFDSLDWDPDLPTAPRSESPEPVTIKPQPVTYTTVGSLVDPNVKPQFSAPRRIQREGANRPTLISMLQGPRFQPYYQARGPPPSLNQSNSMAYAQHIGRSPNSAQSTRAPPATFPSYSQSPGSNQAKEQMQMTELEKEILRAVQGRPSTQIVPCESLRSESTSTLSSATRLSAHAAPFNSRENSRRNTLDLFQELQKQQELPKIASRDSGVKRHPLCKFSRCLRCTITNQEAVRSVSSSPRFGGSPKKPADPTVEQRNMRGELNFAYQFPEPLNASSTSQINPLFGAYGSSTSQPAPGLVARPGYPRPLTAGPPGQRQQQSITNRPGIQQMDSTWAPTQSASASGTFNAQKSSPWANNYIPCGVQNIYINRQAALPVGQVVQNPQGTTNNPMAPTKVIDTLPPNAVVQYFPQGIPSNMNGTYTPLSYNTQKHIDKLSTTIEEQEKKRNDAIDDFFYSGQRRFATMTSDDYITELEDLHHKSLPVYGSNAPPNKEVGPGPVHNKPYTVKEMEKMPIAKAMAPIMNAAFGTMLSYATEGLSSRKALSGWVVADPDQIDDTPEGNQSLFGEDWGAPPQLRRRVVYRGTESSSRSSSSNPGVFLAGVSL